MSYTYAVIEHSLDYYDFYDELLDYVQRHFDQVESGVQGDAWIWITKGSDKVSLDTFYSMQFEINSDFLPFMV